jgi:hypothetical protein
LDQITPAAADNCAAKTDDNCDGFTCGQAMWAKDFPKNSTAFASTIDKDGNIILAGMLSGTTDFGGGPLIPVGSQNIYVAKFDPTGQHIWSKRFGDSLGGWATAAAVDANGAVVIAGRLYGGADFGGGMLNSGGNYSGFVAKYDASGTYVWAKLIAAGSSANVEINGIAVDPAGDVLVAGSLDGIIDFVGTSVSSVSNKDILVGKLASATGDVVWVKAIGDAGTPGDVQYARSVATDGSSSVRARHD